MSNEQSSGMVLGSLIIGGSILLSSILPGMMPGTQATAPAVAQPIAVAPAAAVPAAAAPTAEAPAAAPAPAVDLDSLAWNERAAALLKDEFGQDFAVGTIDPSVAEDIVLNYPSKGATDPAVVVVEYSDFECPFCQRHNSAGTLDNIVAANDNLAKAFGHYPLSFHPNALPSANALECIVDQTGKETFFDYADKIFNAGDQTVATIETLLTTEGTIDMAAWKACSDAGTHNDKVNEQMQLGLNSFGVRGTPGNVILNPKTGEFILVSGAYPSTAFQKVIDQIK